MSSWRDYMITLYAGTSGRLRHNEKPDEHGMFGFWWFFWIPFVQSNGGSVRNGDTCIDYNIHWLCFFAGATLWKKRAP